MLWNFKTLGLLLAVAQGAFILCLGFGTSSPSLCEKCPLDSQSKVTAKIRQVEREAKELFDSYLAHQGFSHNLNRSCYKLLKWFPTGNIAEQPTVTRLQKLRRTMVNMSDALCQIAMQQQELNKPSATLLCELESSWRSARGLLSNINCALCVLSTTTPPTPRGVAGARPTGLKPQAPAPKPPVCPWASDCTQALSPTTGTASKKAFHQKIEGCQVLWNYSRFLEALAQGSERKEQQAGNNKRRKRKSAKRWQAS